MTDIVDINERRRQIEEKQRVLEAAQDTETLCVITVRADSSVNVWVNHRIESKAQFSWLFGQLAAGTAEIVQMEGKAQQ